MNFYKTLQAQTEVEQRQLLECALVEDALAGRMTRAQYVAFLNQAYHHVKHTVPLLMATGSRLPAGKEGLRNAIAEYIKEELGHQEWVLNDIAAAGYDARKARHSLPNRATEVMVAYAYHLIDRVNPVGFFGMVYVLEGTSAAIADKAANGIAASTGLPAQAFSYLRSHGALDIEHIGFFEQLMDRIGEPAEQQLIVHCARNFFHLYADVYRSIEPGQALPLAA